MNDYLYDSFNFYRRAIKDFNKNYELSPKEYGEHIANKRGMKTKKKIVDKRKGR